MTTVLVDIGNSRIKWGLRDGSGVVQIASLQHDQESWSARVQQLPSGVLHWLIASVVPAATAEFTAWCAARRDSFHAVLASDIPLTLNVRQPHLLGVDRALAALAAHHRAAPGQAAIAVCAGTAITVELVDEAGVYQGGAIAPGPWLMAQSLHAHTAKLPLLAIHGFTVSTAPGKATAEAITAGINAAVLGCLRLMIERLAVGCTQPPLVCLAGGSLGEITAAHLPGPWMVQGPHLLVLEGLAYLGRASTE